KLIVAKRAHPSLDGHGFPDGFALQNLADCRLHLLSVWLKGRRYSSRHSPLNKPAHRNHFAEPAADMAAGKDPRPAHQALLTGTPFPDKGLGLRNPQLGGTPPVGTGIGHIAHGLPGPSA